MKRNILANQLSLSFDVFPSSSSAESNLIVGISQVGGSSRLNRSDLLGHSLFDALQRSRDQTKLHHLVKASSPRAYQKAIAVLIHANEKFSYGTIPYIVVPGDGGLIVEWSVGDDFVSVNIDDLNAEMDLLYVQENGVEDSLDFSYSTLDEALTSLFSGEESATIPTISNTAAKASRAFVSPNSIGTSTPSYSY